MAGASLRQTRVKQPGNHQDGLILFESLPDEDDDDDECHDESRLLCLILHVCASTVLCI